MLRWAIATTLFLAVCISAHPSHRGKRQVTYQADDGSVADQDPDIHLVQPVTKKPLPAQIVYPGDLTSFFNTETSKDAKPENNDAAKLKDDSDTTNKNESSDNNRTKRSVYGGPIEKGNDDKIIPKRKPLKLSQSKFRQPDMSESRLHSSYHKPSVSVMNDIPAELYFDGAGFLRYEDDSEESNHSPRQQNYERPPPRHQDTNNNKALREFREVFNVSHERMPNNVKYDDDVRYPDSSIYSRTTQESTIDHGAMGTENSSPLGIDFMNAYQKEMFANMHNNYVQQMSQTPPATYQQDPFSFTYPNFYNSQPNLNQMPQTVMQQEPLLQNHRLQSQTNIGGVASPTVFTSSSQPLQANSGYASNINYPQYAKLQRKKRSVINSRISDDTIASASEHNPDHYRYSEIADQQDSGSGFIPITGSFNGGTIQLNFPIFGGKPTYSQRPPMQTYHTYTVPIQPEGRPYGNTMERFYHPSEARRYSYGILGSGNFEVIRGGVFPGERQSGGYVGGGFPGERIPYGNGFGNYGTTEIILDGPIQGFQGFDNFPAHLINALSKHSELAVQPDRHDSKELAS